MTQIDEITALKTDEQALKLVEPSEGTFDRKAQLINLRLKETLATAFGGFAIAFILSDVRNQTIVEADFACVFGIESGIGIEICAFQ